MPLMVEMMSFPALTMLAMVSSGSPSICRRYRDGRPTRSRRLLRRPPPPTEGLRGSRQQVLFFVSHVPLAFLCTAFLVVTPMQELADLLADGSSKSKVVLREDSKRGEQ